MLHAVNLVNYHCCLCFVFYYKIVCSQVFLTNSTYHFTSFLPVAFCDFAFHCWSLTDLWLSCLMLNLAIILQTYIWSDST